MKKKTLWLVGAGAVALVGGYYLWENHKNTTLTVAALDPQGGPYLGLGGTFIKVGIGLSDGSRTVYIFPLESLPNLAQIKGQNLVVAGRTIAQLRGTVDTGNPSLPGA
jgi:hypothetical protein